MKSITNLHPKSPLRKRGAKLRFKSYFPDREFDMDLAYKTRILKSEKYKEVISRKFLYGINFYKIQSFPS